MSYFPCGFVNPISNINLSFIASAAVGTDVASGNNYTFSTVSIGAADGNRWVIVGVVLAGGATASAVTIDGVSASVVDTPVLLNARYHSFWYAYIPTGTTGNIIVTVATTTSLRCFIAVYRFLSGDAPVVFDSATDSTLTSGHCNITINIKNNGVVLASSSNAVASAPATAWTGLTEDVETAAPDATGVQSVAFAGGTNTFPSAQSAYAIQATFTATPSNGSLYAVSLGGV